MDKLFLNSLNQLIKRLELFKKAITNADEDAPFFPLNPILKKFPKLGVAAGKKLGIADCPSEGIRSRMRQMFQQLY